MYRAATVWERLVRRARALALAAVSGRAAEVVRARQAQAEEDRVQHRWVKEQEARQQVGRRKPQVVLRDQEKSRRRVRETGGCPQERVERWNG